RGRLYRRTPDRCLEPYWNQVRWSREPEELDWTELPAQTMMRFPGPRPDEATPLIIIDWPLPSVISVPPATSAVALCSASRSATWLCESRTVSRDGSKPAIVSLPKPMSPNTNRSGERVAVRTASPSGAANSAHAASDPIIDKASRKDD